MAFLAVVLVAGCGSPTVEELSPSVVRVEAVPCGDKSVGTGSVIGSDLVLTNAHIVAGSTDDVIVRAPDDSTHAATVVAFDAALDLALLRVPDLGLDPVDMGEAVEGTRTSILARPSSLDLIVLEASVVNEFTATGDDIYGSGDVSRRAIELNVDVPPGVSGAGVFDEEGLLVGVVFARSRERDDVSYAVSGIEVIEFVDSADTSTSADTLRCR